MDYIVYSDYQGNQGMCGLTLLPFLKREMVWVVCTALPDNTGPALARSLSPVIRTVVQDRLSEKYPNFSMQVFIHHPPDEQGATKSVPGDRIDSLTIPVELIKGHSNNAEWTPAKPDELRLLLRYLTPPWKVQLDRTHHPPHPPESR